MTKKVTTESYVAECKQEHGDLYDHSKVVYTRAKDKVEIICKKHDKSFWQEALFHKRGGGCPDCARERAGGTQRTTQEGFIESSIAADGAEYDHSLVKYKNSTTKVDLICNKPGHGVFSMLPLNRLRGQQCPVCAQEVRTEKQTKTQETFIQQCLAMKRPNLTFEGAVYGGDKVKVDITCTIHGKFSIQAGNFLQGQGCPCCAKSGYRHSLPGWLYVLAEDNITKVGITNRKPLKRVQEIARDGGPRFDILAALYFKDGAIARSIEVATHKWLAERYEPVQQVFTGSTECFLNVDILSLTNFILPLAQTPEAV